MTSTVLRSLSFACAPLLLLAACGDDPVGEGTVNVTVYGEAFIEEGIPVSEMSDGWAITFDTFEVTVRDVRVGGVAFDDPAPLEIATPTDGAGQVIATAPVREGDHENASFVIEAVDLTGSATKEGDTKTFAWTFDYPVAYDACETTTAVTTAVRRRSRSPYTRTTSSTTAS